MDMKNGRAQINKSSPRQRGSSLARSRGQRSSRGRTKRSPGPAVMAPRYRDRVVVVTGGSKGIGRGIVSVFVENGAKVVFCARGREAGEALETELNNKGPGCCRFISCDMSEEEDIQRLILFTVESFGHIDCLVNNAGWHPPHKTTDDTSAQEFRELLDLNLVSYFLASKLALPFLRQREGNIINVSSLVGSIGQKDAAPYVATKGAIISMTKAMAVDESRHKVRVNCISPGNVWTPLWEQLAAQTPDAEATVKQGQDAQLLGRMGTEQECGLAALFLAADASFCTGIDLLLSGGAELNYGFKSQVQT